MTDQEIIKKAAALNARKSWAARVKKWGGPEAAKEKMRLVRKGKKLNRRNQQPAKP